MVELQTSDGNAATTAKEPMLAAANDEFKVWGFDCKSLIDWRGPGSNRTLWKSLCSSLLTAYVTVYFTLVSDSFIMCIIGGVFYLKLLIEIWGQDTPNWSCPGGWPLFFVMYGMGIPSFIYMYGTCRVQDIDFPHREPVALAIYLGGSFYALSYEVHRFRFKAQPENKGKLHTTYLASLSMHPNYFGDLFIYSGWGLAAGTLCATSVVPMQIFYQVIFIIPNSDAYLASRYPAEFPAYAAATASYIPGLHNKTAEKALAWAMLFLSFFMQTSCSQACGF